MRKPLLIISFAALTLSLSAQEPSTAPTMAAHTGVRIVRLSQVIGDVQLDRGTGHGYEAAFPNLPIVQGSRLRTGKGAAEVEFEDNSSLRLTPNTVVEFPVLSSDAAGARASTVHVVQGEIYASMNKSVGNSVRLTFGRETLALGPAAHLRLTVTGAQPRVDVMEGTVQASNGVTTTEVARKKALLFDPAGTNLPTLVSKVNKGVYAEWDKQEAEYHRRLMPSGGHYAGMPYAYGLADMNYYGQFRSMGSCGTLWQPYMVGAGWSPFSNGVWAWYPTAGYSWVSPYPWGWTAFHTGSWVDCPGTGWGWQPSNNWSALRNRKLMKTTDRVHPPPHNPRPGQPTLIEVDQKPLVMSHLSQDSFTFRRDSAGLGVPRSTFGRLDHISSGVVRQGAVTRPVYFSGAAMHGPEENRAGFSAAEHGGPVIHAGMAPVRSISSSAPTSSGFSGGGAMHGGPSAPVGSTGSSGISAGGSAGASGGSHH